jgi:hypothetical protein
MTSLQPSACCCIFYPEYVVSLIKCHTYKHILKVRFEMFLAKSIDTQLINNCSLISMQLRNRVDVVTVGRLSLNFTGFNRESASIFGNQLYSLIQKLVPYSQAIPLSIEYLNTATLQPRKDNKSGRYVLLGFALSSINDI